MSATREADVTTVKGGTKVRGRWRSRGRSLLFGLVGLTLLLGIPLVLVTSFGNPFTSFPQSLDELSGYYQSRYVPSEVVIGVLVVALWVFWLQFAWAMLWELVVVGPAAAKGGLARSAPFAPRVMQSLASAVISGTLTAGIVVGSSSLAAVGAHLVGTPAALATDADAAVDQVDVNPQLGLINQLPHRLHLVGASESLWSIAGRDDAMVQRLLELNEDLIRSPIDLRPGMELTVPTSLAGLDPTSPPRAEPDLSTADRSDFGDHHVVIEGDNLWEISEARLRGVDGVEPSNQEIADRVAEVVQQNSEVIDDPDLIYPGDILSIADSGAGSVAAEAGAPHSDAGSHGDGATDDETDPGIGVIADVANTNGGTPTAPAGGATRVVVPASEAAAAPPPEIAVPDDGSSPGQAEPQSAIPAIRALAVGSIAAASGLLLGLLALRRKRAGSLGAGAARRQASEDGNRLLLDLSRASDQEFTQWVGGELRNLVEQLPPDLAAAPVAIRLSANSWLTDERGVYLMWDSPMPAPVAGWVCNGDYEWARDYDETESTAPEPGPAAIPGLVTLGAVADGDHEGHQLLVDLEAFGSIAVGGDADQIAAVVRAVAFEAGSGEALSNIVVTTVDFQIDGAEPLERVSGATEDVALARAETIVAQYEEQAAAGAPGYGSQTNGQHDVELFVVSTVQGNTDRWLDVAKPHSGVAVLLIGDMRSSRLGSRLVIDADGVATISPLGIQLNVSGVLPPVAEQLGALFDRALDEPGVAERSPIPTGAEVISEWSGESDKADEHRFGAAHVAGQALLRAEVAELTRAETEPVDGEVVTISVLGRCRCDELPGLAARALSLVVFLAVQPDRCATKESIIEAVWGVPNVSDGQFSKVVASARAHLGPDRLPKQLASDGLFRLNNVETDLDDLQRLSIRAAGLSPEEAAPFLRAAIELITGPPFSGVAIDWAAGNRLVDYASELIEAVTVQAVDALARTGDIEGVRNAAQQGLSALPASEAIYRVYMRAGANIKDLNMVRSTYQHLENALSLLYPTEDRRPSPETIRFVEQLVAEIQADPGDAVPVSATASGSGSPTRSGTRLR